MDNLKLPFLTLGPGIPKGSVDKSQGFINLDGEKLQLYFYEPNLTEIIFSSNNDSRQHSNLRPPDSKNV
jgi:hypothetical protein